MLDCARDGAIRVPCRRILHRTGHASRFCILWFVHLLREEESF